MGRIMNEKGAIYALIFENLRVKIGSTKDINKRLNSYRTHSSSFPVLGFYFEVNDMAGYENWLHSNFDEIRFHPNEFFDFYWNDWLTFFDLIGMKNIDQEDWFIYLSEIYKDRDEPLVINDFYMIRLDNANRAYPDPHPDIQVVPISHWTRRKIENYMQKHKRYYEILGGREKYKEFERQCRDEHRRMKVPGLKLSTYIQQKIESLSK